MKLLEIERQEWGPNKGILQGKIKFDSELGEIAMRLTPEHIQQILNVCADSLVSVSKEVATELTTTVIEQSAAQIGHDDV